MHSFKKTLRHAYRSLPFKGAVYGTIRGRLPLPERVYRHLHFTGVVEIPINAERLFRIRHYGFQVENDLYWTGFGNGWEGTSLRLWVRLAREARIIFDIGANTGVYALSAQAANPSARIFGFEPIDRIAQRFEDNVALNGGDVAVIRAGVSDTTGEAVIFEPTGAHAYSASLDAGMLVGRDDLVETRISVIRIDDFLQVCDLSGVDLVKIDTEKHELAVFEGFGAALERSRPAILVEILDRDLGARLTAHIAPLGYAFYEITEGRGVARVKELGGGDRNYLLCPHETAERLGLGDGVAHGAL